MKSKIPRFRNEREEAEFWDTHDVTDFLDELEDCGIGPIFIREPGVVKVRGPTWDRLRVAARRRRVTPARLVNQWLAEALSAHRDENRRTTKRRKSA